MRTCLQQVRMLWEWSRAVGCPGPHMWQVSTRQVSTHLRQGSVLFQGYQLNPAQAQLFSTSRTQQPRCWSKSKGVWLTRMQSTPVHRCSSRRPHPPPYSYR